MMTAVRRSHRFRQGLIPIGIGIQAACLLLSSLGVSSSRIRFIVSKLFCPICFGAFTGIHYAAIVAWSIRYKRWIWSLALLAGAAFVACSCSMNTGLATIENTWFELALLLTAMAIPLCCVPWARKQLARGSTIGASLSALGAASFGIYLVHPAILTLWDRVAPEPGAHLALRFPHRSSRSHRAARLLAARARVRERMKKRFRSTERNLFYLRRASHRPAPLLSAAVAWQAAVNIQRFAERALGVLLAA